MWALQQPELALDLVLVADPFPLVLGLGLPTAAALDGLAGLLRRRVGVVRPRHLYLLVAEERRHLLDRGAVPVERCRACSAQLI